MQRNEKGKNNANAADSELGTNFNTSKKKNHENYLYHYYHHVFVFPLCIQPFSDWQRPLLSHSHERK